MKGDRINVGIPTLGVALAEHMTANQLSKLASLHGGPVPTRKAEIADLIVKHLEGHQLRAVWQSLDELQKAAVAEVVHSESTEFPADRFHAKYGRAPSWGSLDGYRRDERPTALRFFFYGGGGGGRVMPDDLKERLKAFVPPPASAEVKSIERLPTTCERPWERWNPSTKKKEHGSESIPLTVRESERAAQRELFSMLRLVDGGKVAVSDTTRKASSAAIGAITTVLEGGDYYPYRPPANKRSDDNPGPIRAFAWPLIIQAGGLAQLAGSRLQLTKAGRTALGVPAVETLRALWERWTDTTVLDELSRIECVKGQTGRGKHGLTAVASRREAIAATLTECHVQQWIAADELLRYVRASGNDFAVSRNAWNLYIAEPQYGSLGYDGSQGILENRYLLCLLFEYAATLGLIDVAFIPPAGARNDYHGLWGTDELKYFSRYDGLMFLRITPLGAYCLDMVADSTPAPVEVAPVLRVRPNFEIEAIGAALEQGNRLALDAYAVRVSDLVWRLDPTKLLGAMEEGRSIGEIRQFLAARSGGPIPDTVEHLLEDVANRGVLVRDRGLARLVECADPALAAFLAIDTRTRAHCMRAGERHLVVPASSDAAFRHALRQLGYLLASGEVRATSRGEHRG